MPGLGALTLSRVQNPSKIYSRPSEYTQFLHIRGSTSTDLINQREWYTVVFNTEKNLYISGLVQFKSMLFKDQLYILSYFYIYKFYFY